MLKWVIFTKSTVLQRVNIDIRPKWVISLMPFSLYFQPRSPWYSVIKSLGMSHSQSWYKSCPPWELNPSHPAYSLLLYWVILVDCGSVRFVSVLILCIHWVFPSATYSGILVQVTQGLVDLKAKLKKTYMKKNVYKIILDH